MVKTCVFCVLCLVVVSCKDSDFSVDLGLAVFDKSGNIYNTVKIGDQVWLKQNLQTTLYNNGENIGTTSIANLNIAALSAPKFQWIYQNGSDQLGGGFGLLYTWYTLTDIRGICPPGFRVPTSEDWVVLADFLGGSNLAGGKLKSEGVTTWNSPNTGATNETNFSAIPAGYRLASGNFEGFGNIALHWTSSSSDDENGLAYSLSNNSGVLDAPIQNKKNGLSCRCIKN